jgi:hypothetical protein
MSPVPLKQYALQTTRPPSCRPFDLLAPRHQVAYVLIATLFTQLQQSRLQIEQVLSILTARPFTLQNLARQRLRVLWPQKLRVLGKSNVHETANRSRLLLLLRAIGGNCRRVKGRKLDRIAVNLADVEVFAHFCYFGSWNVVGCAPDAFSVFMLCVFRFCSIFHVFCTYVV